MTNHNRKFTVNMRSVQVNAGTVEFMVEPNGSYYFLEVNPRIQVRSALYPPQPQAWDHVAGSTAESIGYLTSRLKARHNLKTRVEGLRVEHSCMRAQCTAE